MIFCLKIFENTQIRQMFRKNPYSIFRAGRINSEIFSGGTVIGWPSFLKFLTGFYQHLVAESVRHGGVEPFIAVRRCCYVLGFREEYHRSHHGDILRFPVAEAIQQGGGAIQRGPENSEVLL